ncbi:hypothetical protein [Piscirickettsia litoralis]|uniref:Uncharacterized protein n=1 Tax=Piscirickettsia litoralis TaxID=1891921 RepID=A0ABX2ZXU5_9GAMM|nr:hypothetical protein [Piscirickettsia litoralis]ODN41025.1 hypothetical protein BGC07_18515 [Piscirickettsia litoralis]
MKWTDYEKEYLKENYGLKTGKQIAVDLNKTSDQVYSMAKRLGLERNRGTDTQIPLKEAVISLVENGFTVIFDNNSAVKVIKKEAG